MATLGENPLPFWFEAGRGASANEIASAEIYVGHRLPEPLRELLLERDGGISNYAAYSNGETYLPMLPILGVDASAHIGTIPRALDVRESFGIPDNVIVFAAQGNAWWGLDYREERTSPLIVYCDEPGSEVRRVALNFTEFLKGLVEE